MDLSQKFITTINQDRRILLGCLAALMALAWSFTAYQAWGMANMDKARWMLMPSARSWVLGDYGVIFVMWAVMMVAMMIPSAMPMILTFDSVNRQRRRSGDSLTLTWVFISGYLLVWTLFSLAATLLQGILHDRTILTPMMASRSPLFGGAILLAAGLFQLTPFKNTCLKHCRTPLHFLMTGWREGRRGALLMGVKHGLFCTACCWLLMALLFVLGVMNLLWIAAISVFVLIEKVVPSGPWFTRVSGVFLIVWGTGLIFT